MRVLVAMKPARMAETRPRARSWGQARPRSWGTGRCRARLVISTAMVVVRMAQEIQPTILTMVTSRLIPDSVVPTPPTSTPQK